MPTDKLFNYSNLLLTPQWLDKRSIILKRDGNKCRYCGASNYLQVHHRQYHTCSKTGMKKNPWQYDDKYLVTLCRKCHENGHNQFTVPTYPI